MARNSNLLNVNFKTGTLQQSESFIWNTADILGKGATAVVYFGRRKNSGDVVAVKVFHDSGLKHDNARKREVESLSSLNHKNIVKLLGLEKECLTGQEVLVTEYCTGGSLLTCLEQPQNLCGFPESEFLIFLKDIAEGISYIRQKGFVHRDIKPGNIMRSVEDGRSVYKLTDFGTARELQDDETYMSIYGTEEYLHPDMFERAFLRQGTTQSFDATVDLWSLGVTFYHVATGQLPYQPHGGRRDRETRTLQDMLVPMLAGLMETNPQYRWSFKTFFKTAEDIKNRVKLNVFYCCSAENLILYMKPTDTYASIVEVLAGITGIAASNQLVLSSDSELSELVDPTCEIRTYKKSLLQTQIYLFPKDFQDDVHLKIIDIPPFKFSESEIENDAKISKKCAAVACYICTAISQVLQRQELMATAKYYFSMLIRWLVRCCQTKLPHLRSAISEVRKTFEAFGCIGTFAGVHFGRGKMQAIVSDAIKSLPEYILCTWLDFLEKIEIRMSEIENYIQVLLWKVNEQEQKSITKYIKCTEEDCCLSKAENLKQKIIGVMTIMIQNRQCGDLHSHEIFIHQNESQKLKEYFTELESIFHGHCMVKLKHCYNEGMKNIRVLCKHLTRTKKLEQNIAAVMDSIQKLSHMLGKENDTGDKISDLETKLLASLKEAEEFRKKYEESAASVTRLQGEVEKKKKELSDLQHKLTLTQDDLAKAKNMETELKNSFEELSEDNIQNEEDIVQRELDEERAHSEMQMAVLNENLTTQAQPQKIDELRGQKLDLQANLDNSNEEKRILLERCLKNEGECEKLQEKVTELRCKLDDMEAAMHELGRENQSLQEKVTELHHKLDDTEAALHELGRENQSSQEMVTELRHKLDDTEAALHELGRENQSLQILTTKVQIRKWTDDNEVNNCMGCNKAFSLTVRKHHCRNCGSIFCNECSAKECELAASKKPVRVCDACYEELAKY